MEYVQQILIVWLLLKEHAVLSHITPLHLHVPVFV